jgi:DNA-binding CsgD family transcriptional regulator
MVLFGRDIELARLLAALDGDRLSIVVGEAGVGKTALVRAAVDTTGRRLYEGGGFATLSWMPNLALERAVGRALHGDADWAAAVVEQTVGPDVLFVDDAQWIDPGTLDVLVRLTGRIAAVCAIRPGDVAADAALERLVAAGGSTIEVPPLGRVDAISLVRRLRPSLSRAAAARIAERAGGNPLLIEELGTTAEPSDSLKLALRARLSGLDDTALRSVGLLALADRPIGDDVVGADTTQLVRAGLVTRRPDGLAIRHALLGEAIVESLDPSLARELHGLLGRRLHDPGERARHLAAAGDRATAHRLALEAVAAASNPGERAAHLATAAATAEGADADALRIEAAAALRVAGDLAAATGLLDRVSAVDAELVARAQAVRARICWSAGDPDGMRAAVAGGLAAVDGTASAAEAALRAEHVVVTALVDGRFEEGLVEADRALSLARASGSDATRALLLRATILTGLGRDGWVAALEEVVASARAAGDAETELSAANNLITGHEMYGDPAAGRALAGTMVDRAATLRLAGWERQFGALLSGLELHAGELRGALERAEALLEEPLDPLARQQVGLTAALALVDLGRFDAAGVLLDDLFQAAPDDVAGRGDVLWVLAEAALWGGRPDESLRCVGAYAAYAASEYPNSHLVDVTAAWAAHDAGRPIPAALARARPLGMTVGAQLERAAIERLAASDVEAATDGFETAARAFHGYHRRGELRCGWAAGEARRRAGDRSAARAQLEVVEAEAAAAGFEPLLGRVHRSLRLLGLRRAARRVPGPSGDRLTAREREITDLVGRGLSNIEIARRLGVGRPTVARLLGSAMGKLGVDSRTQLAAAADL